MGWGVDIYMINCVYWTSINDDLECLVIQTLSTLDRSQNKE